MKIGTHQVFNDTINGTSSTWYTGTEFNGVLGIADEFAVQAVVTQSSATGTLTIRSEHSADGEHWVETDSTPEINAVSLGNTSFAGTSPSTEWSRFVRFKITMGSTSPKCLLKLYVTTRAHAMGAPRMARSGR